LTKSATRLEQQTKRFEFVSRLGQGESGEVFEAIDRERGARVAVKTLRTPTAEMIRSLKREFRSVQDIQHPNLVRLGELFEEDGRWFFTMEFIQGIDFLQYVSLSGDARSIRPPRPDESVAFAAAWRFDEPKLRACLLQLTSGLLALHGAGKIHRDIKPSNVLVTREGRVVILDFGIMLDAHDGVPLDQGAMIGTPHYMAPEQASGEEVASAADWYGVGGMLFYALTGTLPFLGAMRDILENKITQDAPKPSQFAKDLPADLEELCIDLLQSEPSARPSGPTVLRRLTGNMPANENDSPRASGVFVGRRRELSELADAHAATAKGGTVTVFLQGQSGVGKSALIRTFTDRLVASSTEKVIVLRGRCYERESVPFKGVDGLIDSLSQFLLSLEPDEVSGLLPEGFDLVCRAFPVLADISERQLQVAATAEVSNPNEQRARLFAAVRELLTRVGKRQQLVLVVDDLQWTDSDSLALLLDVLRPPNAPRLLFVATMRAGTQQASGVRATDEQLARLEGDVRHLYIEKLPADDAERLATFLLGDRGEMSTEEIRAIAQEAGGHPLFIDELVRQRAQGGASGGLLKLDDALWQRVTRLDPESRQLLEVIVVAGAPIQQEKASHAAGLDAERLFQSAATLRNAHMISSGGVRSDDRLEAYHDRVRESVFAHLDEKMRMAIHARIAVAEEQSSTPDAEALATHWEGAGNPQRATGYAVLAGDRAIRALAFARAARWYRKALELGGAKGAETTAIRAKLAEALTSDGHDAEAADVRVEMAADAAPVEALDLRRHAAEQYLISGRFERGYALLRDTLAAVGERFPKSPLAVVFWVLVSRLRLRLRGLSFQERDPAATDRAMLVRIDSLWSAGSGFAMTDNIRGAYFQTRNLLLALEAGDLRRIARGLAMEVCFTSAGGLAKRAHTFKLLAEAKTLAARDGTPYALAFGDTAAAYASFMNGEWRDAKAALISAEDRLRDQCIGVNWLLSSVRTILYRTLILRGELSELAERLPPVVRAAEQRGDDYATLNLRASPMTTLHIAADRPKEALENLEELFKKLPKGVFHVQHFYVLLAALELDVYAGDPKRGLSRLTEHERAMKRSLLLRVERFRISVFDQRGRCALAAAALTPTALPADLIASATADAAALLRIQSPSAQSLSYVLRAGLCALSGDRAGTMAELSRAEQAFTTAEMFLHTAAVRRRLAQLAGGADVERRVADAEAWMEKVGIRNKEAMTRMLIPGVECLLPK